MTTKIDYIRLGFILSTHALSGDVELHLDISGDIFESFPYRLYLWRPLSPSSGSYFYLDEDSSVSLESYEVEKIRPFKRGALLKLKGCDSHASAENLRGMLVYFNTQEGNFNSSYLFWFLGFEVFRRQAKQIQSLGRISYFQSHNHQDWMIVKNGNKKIEIPFISDYIEKIDEQNKKLILDLPSLFPGID